MKGRTKDKQKFNEEIDVLALFCFRGRAIASGGQIVLTPKRDVLHPVTLRVPQSLLGETTAGATTEGTSLRVCLWLTPRLSPNGTPSVNTSRLRRETPSGSPVACGGKPSFSTGLTACSAGFTATHSLPKTALPHCCNPTGVNASHKKTDPPTNQLQESTNHD